MELLLCYLLLPLAAAFTGLQIQLSELRLLTGHYRYEMQRPQLVTLTAAAVAIGAIIAEAITAETIIVVFAETLLFVPFWLLSEWLLAKLSPRHLLQSLVYRFFVIVLTLLAIDSCGCYSLLPFLIWGVCLRNNPLGIVHGKPMEVVFILQRKGQALLSSEAPVWSSPSSSKCFYNVVDYGIRPDTDCDVLPAVQALIDEVGRHGGGTIFFPRGRYFFNKTRQRQYLQINHSHITLEGELNEKGRLLTEFVNCGTTIQGDRNPWLSPFFITTGEQLQPSNTFWGLDFRKPSGMRMESSSLSDPGSNGFLLTPPLATAVTKDALKGSRLLTVEDSSRVGHYILLGMYNTTPDATLLKEMLGVSKLRPEWLTARRAGHEEAPSFQWLVEVTSILDEHTIELSRPLLRDCLMKHQPAIYNVDMLEDIHIRHLRLNSRWNGLFHHHGLPLYYSVAQAQEMDYGWNAINVKRAAHSSIEHVEISNFTNPLYVQDSREVTVTHVDINGYDGHQGLKVYCHTCDCEFSHITFRCHYADMMGGEGNAYANRFSHISYLNPTFHPVDFDFHGFSEGPMSPPAYNVFEQVEGFRYIKGAGAIFMQPACAAGNIWRNLQTEGERKGTLLFYALSYRVKSGLEKFVTAAGYTLVMILKKRNHSIGFAKKVFTEKLHDIDSRSVPRSQHGLFFPGSYIENVQTTATLP
ncbi:MAG: hypothetical protein IJ539_04915 [Prevotella sp.]|nr:hypothetical protein [Prevotella sp.]